MAKYLNNLFAKKRILGDDTRLEGLVKADDLLADLVNQQKIPGLSVTVLEEGKTIFQKGYGHADLEAKTRIIPEETVFRVASVSKPIAATALAHMVVEGIIDLDASFRTYVPYYPKKKYDFTIRQLASHTAGIRSYRGTEYGLNRPYSIKEGIDLFKNDPLLFEPGTGYHYNSYDWVLISLAMQEASGIPFVEYVHEKVLEPLGMDHTFAPTAKKGSDTWPGAHRLATSYSRNRLGFREAIPVNNHYKLAGGGYLSTSGDIAKLGQAYLEGKILDKKTLQPFLTSQNINGTPTYYGLGWQVSEDTKGRSYYGHVGNGVGGYSNFFVYPNEQMVVAILINCTDPKVQDVLDTTVNLLMTSKKPSF
ncbi:beta-lactamase family protein [Flavobacteriaceae bacterium TP-CH-4]|uniref:Beta-lactamase family protein n=1 Tax=Pelagihabitans pacificus TaxID=2696054 RepID=A0A967E7S3_9FLAO|nr:beta-lactamase family protein [Pelagihabitans pacificus]